MIQCAENISASSSIVELSVGMGYYKLVSTVGVVMIATASGSCIIILLYTSLGVGYLAMAVVLIATLSGLTPEDDTLQPRQRTYVPQFWQLHMHYCSWPYAWLFVSVQHFSVGFKLVL